MKKFFLSIVLALTLAPGFGSAQDFEAGVAAIRKGDYATVLREWTPLAEQGDAEAQYMLAIVFYYGDAAVQDHAKAAEWFRLAAEQGHSDAQYNLGLSYDRGVGVPQDDFEAQKWYRMAAVQGEAQAQLALSKLYYFGAGVDQDFATALMWIDVATASRHGGANVLREKVAAMLTPEAIEIAEKRARVCVESKYQNCD